MKRTIFRTDWLLTGVAVACFGGPAWAQSSIGVGAGITRQRWPATLRPNSELWLTANIRTAVGSRFAVEAEGGHWSGTVAPQDTVYDIRDIYLGGSVLSLFRHGRLVAAIGGGGGWHIFRAMRNTHHLGLHVVTGLECAAGRNAVVFISGRREWIDRSGDSLWLTKVYGGVRLRL